jgi:hypothetical protein
MKQFLLLLLFSVFLFSCDDEEFSNKNYHQINFDVSEWVLKGENITCLDFDSEGNAWIGSGTSLIFYDGKRIRTYDAGSEILDISASHDGRIWLGTKDRGLACFSDQKFVYYTKANAGLPRDLILAVEAAPDGSVWFSSSAHMLGGLMHFDGRKYELFTPENSPLNQNLIIDLKVDRSGNVFLSSEGTVTQAKVFMIDNRKNWKILGGDMEFYWIASLDVTSRSEVVVATDHSLSSCWGCYKNEVVIYRKGNWEKIETEFEMGFFNRMFVDRRDFIWVQGSIKGDYNSYFVYDGKGWNRSKKGQIPEVFIKSAKVDPHNDIWFCTTEGIFILKQQ